MRLRKKIQELQFCPLTARARHYRQPISFDRMSALDVFLRMLLNFHSPRSLGAIRN